MYGAVITTKVGLFARIHKNSLKKSINYKIHRQQRHHLPFPADSDILLPIALHTSEPNSVTSEMFA